MTQSLPLLSQKQQHIRQQMLSYFLFSHFYCFCTTISFSDCCLYLLCFCYCYYYFTTTESLTLSLKNHWCEKKNVSASQIFSCSTLFQHHYNICWFLFVLINFTTDRYIEYTEQFSVIFKISLSLLFVWSLTIQLQTGVKFLTCLKVKLQRMCKLIH